VSVFLVKPPKSFPEKTWQTASPLLFGLDDRFRLYFILFFFLDEKEPKNQESLILPPHWQPLPGKLSAYAPICLTQRKFYASDTNVSYCIDYAAIDF